MMEAASSSETLVNFCQTTWRNIPEDSLLSINSLTGEYLLIHQVVNVCRNVQILPDVCQKMAEYVQCVTDHTHLIRKFIKILCVLQIMIFWVKQCAVVCTSP
jgi:hypothetical protein